MKKQQTKIILQLAFCLFAFSQTIWAQTDYTIKEPKSNHIKLSGTSSLHDWNMNAHTFSGKAEFDFKEGDDLALMGINSLTFSLPVTNLKSDKKGLDKNAYEALNTDKYKNITYVLSSAKVSPEKGDKFLIKSKGKITIAGVTKDVAMDVYCMVNKDASIRCSGTETLKMSDYKVKPPSFFLGAMKTGDDLKLDFNIAFTKN